MMTVSQENLYTFLLVTFPTVSKPTPNSHIVDQPVKESMNFSTEGIDWLNVPLK